MNKDQRMDYAVRLTAAIISTWNTVHVQHALRTLETVYNKINDLVGDDADAKPITGDDLGTGGWVD